MANLISGLGGSEDFGENFLDRNDDGSTSSIDIGSVFPNGLLFFGSTYNSLFVNNNGNVTFLGPLSEFTPFGIPGADQPIIAPFFADVDTRSGEVTPTPGGISQGSNLVWYDLDAANGRFTVTYDDVGYYLANTDLLNAFQLILEDASSDPGGAPGDFNIEFRYEITEWTTGDESGGIGGLGGTPARAGYSAGDGLNFFELPQSGFQDQILELENTIGNTGEAGIWRFEVRGGVPEETVSIQAVDFAKFEGDAGATVFEFQVTRTGDNSLETIVGYRVDSFGSNPADSGDFVSGSFPEGQVTFLPGQAIAQALLEIPVNGDTDDEDDEGFSVTLFDPDPTDGIEIQFGSNPATVTILDDDRQEFRNFGDPHIQTLDGLNYDFQAVGEFVLIESIDGDDLQVQVRTAPVGELVSINSAVATLVDGQRVTINALDPDPLRIDGAVTSLAPGEMVAVGAGEISLNDDIYTIVYPNGEKVLARDFGDRLDLGIIVSSARDPGTLRGLLGTVNGDPTDDLALPDGTVFDQPITFVDLYGPFADGWRVTDASSLFDYGPGENTDTFTERDFPRQATSLDDLPEDIIRIAEDAVDAAGITDPVLRDAAILDFALTSDPSYIDSALSVPPPVDEADVTDVPDPLANLSIYAQMGSQPEGTNGSTSFIFDVYRTGNTDGDLTVLYEVVPVGSDPANEADFAVGALPSGVVSFSAGNDPDTPQVVEIQVVGDGIREADETFGVEISVDASLRDDVIFAKPSADAAIENDDVENQPPTVSLENEVASLPEDTDTTNGVKLADIVIVDDGLGSNNLSLSGADAAAFEIDGDELFLRAGTVLDSETKDQFDVTVEVNDPAVGTDPDDSDELTLTITNVEEPREASIFNTEIFKSVSINKDVGLVVTKNVNAAVEVFGNLATAEASADSIGSSTLAETDTFAQATNESAFSFAEALAAISGDTETDLMMIG